MTPESKIRKGLWALEATDTFLASIAINLKLKADSTVGTMATDGVYLYYSPEFVMDRSIVYLNHVFVHEVLHVAFEHPIKLLKYKNRELGLIAAELAVNGLISGRPGFPRDVIIPGEGEYTKMPAGKNVDWYYQELLAKQGKPIKPVKSDGNNSGPNNGPNNGAPDPNKSTASGSAVGNTTGQLGKVLPYPCNKDTTPGMAHERWERIVANALNQAKAAGPMPGGWEELINELIGVTKVPWYQILRQYITRTLRRGRTYRRPNKRSLYREDIQPSRISKGIGSILLGIDTSGSMSGKDMTIGLSTCIDIGKVYPDFNLTIVQFDAAITRIDKFDRFTANKHYFDNWSWRGRGGTSYRPFFDHIKVNKCNPNVIIVITDGQPNDGWPSLEGIGVPIFWVLSTDTVVPPEVLRYSNVIRVN